MLTRILSSHGRAVFVRWFSAARKRVPGRQLSFLILICAVAASVWGLARVSAKRTVQPSDAQPSLGALLKPDGTLNLARGFQGGLNARGYRMEYAADGAPRFVPAAPTVEAWDTQFVNTNGVQRVANVVAASGTDVYVAGQLTTAGTTLVSNIAKWNGSSWSSLGSGVDGQIFAIAVSGSDVYVGGQFTTAGGAPAGNIAKWNGSTWSALGSGISGGGTTAVGSLAINGTDLYVGGQFTTAGGVSAGNIAKWNGSVWSALGSGTSGTVNAIAISGGNVYAGGSFVLAGGNAANHIARWDGSAWSPL
ncbi:MAG TPA: hypothetical protein PK012_34310, partial [Blastocatellia bacterium]|nr:hypothetical protein [Blastocatellia bacterium]